MAENLIVSSSITINAPISKVWNGLTNPSIIKEYLFGSDVVSDWKEGSPIVWKGMWQGKPYEDKGTILKLVPQKEFKCTHFSPLSGAEDKPENYHTLTYELTEGKEGTTVSLSQDNNATEDEKQHSKQMWDTMLGKMKEVIEKES